MLHQLRRLDKIIPIRLHLTFWYLITLIVLCAGFVIYLHIRFEDRLLRELDTSLELAANQAANYIGSEAGQLVFLESDALARLEEDYSLVLVAEDGTLLAQLGDPDTPLPDTLATGYTLFERPKGIHHRNEDEWRVYTRPVIAVDSGVSGWLHVGQSLKQTQSTLRSLTNEVHFVFPLTIIVAGIGGFLLSARAMRPIEHITRTAQAINTTDLNQRINYDGPNDEIGRLAHTFDRMLDRLEAGFERERRFSGNAAHELRTPLTALKGQIGVTLSRPRQPDEYAATLRSMEQQVDRLIRLSSDMLLMTRLDQQPRQPLSDSIKLDELLGALVDQVRPLAEDKQITLVEELSVVPVIQGCMDLLIRLFMNLLDNAIKYTPSAGQITVHTTQEDEYVTVYIRDIYLSAFTA
jgi:signal transduction histidine kinase